jgi:tRNA pseudouridine13 synthase
MKLKQTPDDFQVEELTDATAGEQGPFALYRLEKNGWTTHDALGVVRRRWKLEARRVSYGGLKDRHARTVQYFTVLRGPRRKLTQQNLSVTYLGQRLEPFSSHDIRANRFRVTLRSLGEAEAAGVEPVLDEMRCAGLGNYFDDQRFGSVAREDGRFVAKELILGQYEEALKLVLAEPYEYDRAAQKKEKAVLCQHWRDWPACKEKLSRGHARSLVDYLVHHPVDYRGAVARLRPELRGLYLSAYQSHLWNRMLARFLRNHLEDENLVSVRLRLGEVPMPRRLTDDLKVRLSNIEFPLPSPRAVLEAGDPRKPALDTVLAEEALTLEQFKLRGFKELFFSRGDRPCLVWPNDMNSEIDADELHRGRRKAVLSFELPRGSYATLVVKRIQQSVKPLAA